MRRLIRLATRRWLPVCLIVFGLLQGCGAGPEPDPATLALDQARQAWLAGDYATAEERYQRYLQDVHTGPDRLEAWKRLADIALSVWHNPANALRLLEAARLEAGPDSDELPQLTRQAVEAALAAGNAAAALKLLDALAARPQASPEDRVLVYLGRQRALWQRHDPAGALASLEECRRLDLPANLIAPCGLRLATLRLELGQPDLALPVWQALYENGMLDAKYRAEAGFALAEAAEARGDKVAARGYYERIRDWHPNPKVVTRKLEYIGK